MSATNKCKFCESDDVSLSFKTGLLRCNDCGKSWPPASNETVSLAEESTTEVTLRCKALAEANHWVDEIETEWPTPIAFEYHRLRELLRPSTLDLVGAVWQFKDVAEVLIKFPTLCLFSDLFAHTDSAGRMDLLKDLLEKLLSLGDWQQICWRMAKRVLNFKGDPLISRRVALLFLSEKQQKETDLAALLRDFVTWRNEEIGHGAFRLDKKELLRSLEEKIPKLNGALKEFAATWETLSLCADSPDPLLEPVPLKGWGPNVEGADGAHAGHTRNVATSLYIKGGMDSRVDLKPYMEFRQCSECQQRDIFFFDTYKSRDKNLYFLDYFRGHKMGFPVHVEPQIADHYAEITRRALDVAEGKATTSLVSAPQRSIQLLLEAKQLESEIISPTFLRKPLAAFLQAHDRGVYWLKASGHVGKTMFVADLVKNQILAGARTCAFHIKREYYFKARQFGPALRDALSAPQVLDIGYGAVPELMWRDADPTLAFTQWIEAMRSASGFPGRLLICIDGLDELPLPEPGEPSIADFIPEQGHLPKNVYVLLTSRPDAECPNWLNERLRRLAPETAFSTQTMNLETDLDYHALMRKQFDLRLAPRWRSALQEAISASASAPAQVGASVLMPAAWKSLAKVEFEKSGRVDWGTANAVFQDFDNLAKSFLSQSEYRFLFFSYLVETCGFLKNWHSAKSIPSGEAMLEHFITEVSASLSTKAHDLAMRVMLTLAAMEEAWARDSSWQTVPQIWRGAPLSLLAAMLGEATESDRLVFVLYTLKTVLVSDKTDAAADARFSLGLKGLVQTLQKLYPEKLRAVHEGMAAQFINNWDGRYAEIPEADLAGRYGLAMVMAHAELGGDPLNKSDPVLQRFIASASDIVNDGWVSLATKLQNSPDCEDAQVLKVLDRIIRAQNIVIAKGPASFDENLPPLCAGMIRNVQLRVGLMKGMGLTGQAVEEMKRLLAEAVTLECSLIDRKMAHDGVLAPGIAEAERTLGLIFLEDLHEFPEAEKWLTGSIARATHWLQSDNDPQRVKALLSVLIAAHIDLAKCCRHLGRMVEWAEQVALAEAVRMRGAAAKVDPIELLRNTVRLCQERLIPINGLDADIDRLAFISQYVALLDAVPGRWQTYDRDLAGLLTSAAREYVALGREQEALVAYQRAVDVQRRASRKSMPDRARMGGLLATIGGMRVRNGDLIQASSDFDNAKQIFTELDAELPKARWSQDMLGNLNAFEHNHSFFEQKVLTQSDGSGSTPNAGLSAVIEFDRSFAAAEAIDMSCEAHTGLCAWQACLSKGQIALAKLAADADNEQHKLSGGRIQACLATCHLKMGIAAMGLNEPDSAAGAAASYFGDAVKQGQYVLAQCALEEKIRFDTTSNLATSLQWLGYLDSVEDRQASSLKFYQRSVVALEAEIGSGELTNLDTLLYGLGQVLMTASSLKEWDEFGAAVEKFWKMLAPRMVVPAIYSDKLSEIMGLVQHVLSTVDDDQFTVLCGHAGASREDVAALRKRLRPQII